MPAPDRSRLPGSLSAERRARDLAAVAGASVDVGVVGGGVTGPGVALDAASRGLSVVLLERADLASGTSRWSSKLVHGGLRYLAHGEIGLARESARERAVLLGATAPHLVRRLPFLVPDVAGRNVTALAQAHVHVGAVDGGDRGAGEDAGAVLRGRASERHDQPRVVGELAVPEDDAAPAAAHARGQPGDLTT